MADQLSLRISTIGFAFQTLRVGATLYDGKRWLPVHLHPSQHDFELAHGVEGERNRYNARSLKQAWQSKRPVHGRHAGLSDLFVPVLVGDRVRGILVTGPFSTARATTTEVLERWRWLTGRHGHPADPEFSHFLSVTLSILALEGQNFERYQRLLATMSQLMAGDGGPSLVKDFESLSEQLFRTRHCEVMWEWAQSMISERSARTWSSSNRMETLRELGLGRVPDQALVALALTRQHDVEPVEEAIRCDAFQRACAELATKVGNVVAGKLGDHGVVFLSAFTGSKEHRRHKLETLADRVAALARQKFEFGVHFGSSATTSSTSLVHCYQRGLAAAEDALARGVRMVAAERETKPAPFPLRKLRDGLCQAAEEQASAMLPRFERYFEAVAFHSPFRLDLARAHLDAALEGVGKVLARSGTLDKKSFDELCAGLERPTAEAHSLGELITLYRRAVGDLVAAVETPAPARHSRSLRRAIDYIDQHYAEPLSLKKVASIAGFAPKYFSHLFGQRERITFEDYLRRVRLERAKQLLSTSALSLARVAELSGFSSAPYFCHAFKRTVGQTPGVFRKRAFKQARPKRPLASM